MDKFELKKYLETDNKSGYKTREKHIKNKFPEIFEIIISNIDNNWFTNLYNYVFDVYENKLCPQCGKLLQVKRFDFGYPQYCSRICKNININFREKVKKTNLLRYGVDNPAKNNLIKEKIKNKACKNGVWYVETDEFKNKSKETCNKKYGVD